MHYIHTSAQISSAEQKPKNAFGIFANKEHLLYVNQALIYSLANIFMVLENRWG